MQSFDKGGRETEEKRMQFFCAKIFIKEAFLQRMRKTYIGSRKDSNMGAGAGYSIDSAVKIVKVNAIKCTEIKELKYYKGFPFADGIDYSVTFDCDIDAAATVEANSYMYTSGEIENCDVKIDRLEMSLYVSLEDGRRPSQKALNAIAGELAAALAGRSVKLSYIYGAGWCHCRFNGSLVDESDRDSIEHTDVIFDYQYHKNGICSYEASVSYLNARLTKAALIEFIDQAVTNDNAHTSYLLYSDGELLECFSGFKEALEEAQILLMHHIPLIKEVLEYEFYSDGQMSDCRLELDTYYHGQEWDAAAIMAL